MREIRYRLRLIIVLCSFAITALLCGLLYLSWLLSPSFNYELKLFLKLVQTQGVVVVEGKVGWLFYRPALKSILKPWPKENIENIIQLKEELLQDSIQLLVVPVPNKNDIYPELLGLEAPEYPSKQRQRFIQNLNKNNVNVLDLYPKFQSIKKRDTMFLKYDSHWNQTGILVAAQEITEVIKRMAQSIPMNLVLHTKDTTGHRYDDLSNLLFNGTKFDNEGPYRWKKVVLPDGNAYSNDSTGLILVFGDSFINAGSDVNAQLSVQISRLTGSHTQNYFRLLANINGPTLLKAYLKQLKIKPKIVVWVFTSVQLMNKIS